MGPLSHKSSITLPNNLLHIKNCNPINEFITMEFFSSSAKNIALVVWSLLSSSLFLLSNAQQQYINNKQLDCDNNKNVNYTNGFVCNGPQTTCTSYLTFRSQPPYVFASTIGYLMTSEPSAIAKINNITDVETIPTDTQIIVPVNCSCSGGLFYQHNASYRIKTTGETYFSVANNTYQGLSTCQALINQNPYGIRDLVKDLKLLVPLRCACASAKQSANGVRFLLVYLVTWGDTVGEIGNRFGVDEKSINDANELSETGRIYPFTSLLIPLKSEPKKISSPPPPPPPSPPPPPPAEPEGNSNKKWVFIGIGIGAGLFVLVLISVILWFILRRRRDRGHLIPVSDSAEYTKGPAVARAKNSEDVSSQGVRNLVDSLTMYKYEELEKATANFGEDQRIKGSVYRGMIRGDYAAIKRTRINDPGDNSSETEREINILKQINHSSIIRLSGYCTQEDEGNTYLVYEYAENGSLSDWLHDKKPENRLGWKQRVQIAYDVADGLNYLHNYTNPAYVHKDLKSSNILLNGDFRAKMTNFGLARTVENDSEDEDGGSGGGGGLHLTRHVVGTRGYMPPEYIENGVVTPKLDVFAFGVVMLELISGKEASAASGQGGDVSLSLSIKEVLEGENVREKLKAFIDPSLGGSYPLDSAFSVADLAMKCVAHDINSRPTMSDVFMSLSKILSSCLDWDPSDELEVSRSLGHGR